jgi:hypothetical protein
MTRKSMGLASGTKLGPYEIVAPLGAGGMGEVYRARDTRLERTVAIKILPAQFSADPVRKQRFEREAKTISSLNHPHICVLYDVGHEDGTDYLVMECVEGETLAKRLEKGPLPLEQVLKYGAQIADALDKAHRRGVVHRDLKPGNIVLASTGAKLLDFGLAKPVSPLASGMTLTANTPRAAMTEEGTIVGTFQYMSPEQVEGKEVDGRSDIFSLGAVLYEMVTGKKAFEGKSQLSVASAILEKEPAPLTAVKPMTPPALDHVIRKCLAKVPDDRWQSASDLASELKWITEGGSHAAVGAVARPRIANQFRNLAWLVAGALLAILVIAATWWWNPKPSERTLYFHDPFPTAAQDIVIAANGHTLALVAYLESVRKQVLWVHEVGTGDAKWFGDTAGARFPFWAPDGKSVGFFADGKLKKLDLSSGQVQIICDAPSGRGGTWNKDGVIVFTPDASGGVGLYRVLASGGTATPISKLDAKRGELSHRWPIFLPDGKHYLYMAANFAAQKGVDAIFVGSLESNEKHFVTKADANAAYAAPGYLLFYRDGALFAQRFDLKRLGLTGEAKVLLKDVQYQPQIKKVVFDASNDGLLVAQTGSGVALSRPVWFDRKGKELGAAGEPSVYGNVALAPNGKSVATSVTDIDNQNTDIWTYDLQQGSAKRLTFDPAPDSVPIWSPDGAKLVFSSNRQSPVNPQSNNNILYMKTSDGKQEEKPVVYDGGVNNYTSDWSRDGKYILFTRDADLWYVAIPDLKSTLFLKAVSVLKNGQFSPDGRWVAYASNETGKSEIYVTSFPDAHGKWQVSIGEGEQPRWRGDGKELFYLSPDGKMMSVPVTTGAKFDAGAPVGLFQATPRQPVPLYDLFVYDVSRDGQEFLIITPVKQAETQPMFVVLNWPAELNN